MAELKDNLNKVRTQAGIGVYPLSTKVLGLSIQTLFDSENNHNILSSSSGWIKQRKNKRGMIVKS